MARAIDLTGLRFGRLLVLHRLPNRKRHVVWACRCDCGTIISAMTCNLRNNRSQSCGCRQKEIAAKTNTTHGMKKFPEYRVWNMMKDRCLNPRSDCFSFYGGRGITVCDSWLSSFEQFYADMGPRPSAKHQLERIDNDGPYSPDNCRWATRTEQQRNKRNNRLLTHNGKTQPIAAWAEETGLTYTTIYQRLQRGFTVSDALTMPAKRSLIRE